MTGVTSSPSSSSNSRLKTSTPMQIGMRRIITSSRKVEVGLQKEPYSKPAKNGDMVEWQTLPTYLRMLRWSKPERRNKQMTHTSWMPWICSQPNRWVPLKKESNTKTPKIRFDQTRRPFKTSWTKTGRASRGQNTASSAKAEACRRRSGRKGPCSVPRRAELLFLRVSTFLNTMRRWEQGWWEGSLGILVASLREPVFSLEDLQAFKELHSSSM